MPCGCRPRVVGELDLIGLRFRQLQWRESEEWKIKGISKRAIVNMYSGIKTE